MLHCRPIGIFYTDSKSPYELPRQSGCIENRGCLILNPDMNFEQALEDLEGFDRLWLLFWFHENQGWQPKVNPPRGGKKRGLFATRSPHRPNPIGLSSVKLLKIEGRSLYIQGHDLLNETPILDIKPYLAYADAYPEADSGWLTEMAHTPLTISATLMAREKNEWINALLQLNLIETVTPILQQNPYPSSSNRIKKCGPAEYILAYKTWRLPFVIDDTENSLTIQDILSGYTKETLYSSKQYPDHQAHVLFLERYS